MQLKYLHGGEFTGMNAWIKMEKISQINNLISYLKTIKKKKPRKLELKLAHRRTNKNGAEINDNEKQKKKKSVKPKAGSLRSTKLMKDSNYKNKK